MADEIVLAEQSSGFWYVDGFGCYMDDYSLPTFVLEVDTEYIIVWNGVSYNCVAIETSVPDISSSTVIAAGNIGILTGEEQTSEPFVICYGNNYSNIFTSSDAESNTIAVYKIVPTVVLKDMDGYDMFFDGVTAVKLKTSTGGTQIFYKSEAGTGGGTEEYENSHIATVGDYTYSSLSSIKSVILSKAISLGLQAFSYCANLEKADFPVVTSISASCFSGCKRLVTLILRSDNIVETSLTGGVLVDALVDTPISNGDGYIYVPSTLIETYKSKWYSVSNQFRAIEDYPDICG